MHGFHNFSWFLTWLASTFKFCGKFSISWPLLFSRLTFWQCFWSALLAIFLSIGDFRNRWISWTFWSPWCWMPPLVLILQYFNFLLEYIKHWYLKSIKCLTNSLNDHAFSVRIATLIRHFFVISILEFHLIYSIFFIK